MIYKAVSNIPPVGAFYNKPIGENIDNSGSLNGHQYVDLGLPSGTLWATCNVGASKPEEYGDYFAWGETTGYKSGKTTFKWTTYKYCNGTARTLTKYCSNSSLGIVDNKTSLDSEDDAATVNWGSGWRMPTNNQLKELYNSSYTTTEWTTINNVYGRKVTSKKNGNYLFLPAGGNAPNTGNRVGTHGYLWSCSCTNYYASGISFDIDNFSYYVAYRYEASNVRPVCSIR